MYAIRSYYAYPNQLNWASYGSINLANRITKSRDTSLLEKITKPEYSLILNNDEREENITRGIILMYVFHQ